jgi:hypothetical protein
MVVMWKRRTTMQYTNTSPIAQEIEEFIDYIVEESDVTNTESTEECTISTEPMVAELEAAYSRTKTDLVERVEYDKQLGLLFLKAKKDVIPKSNLGVAGWVKRHLTFSHQYSNRCAALAKTFDKFAAAHEWYRQAGIYEGYRTKKNTGVDYALDVIRLHHQSMTSIRRDGSAEGAIKAASKTRITAKEKVANLESELGSKQTAISKLIVELERVVALYRDTESGADFESNVLNSVMQHANEAGTPPPKGPGKAKVKPKVGTGGRSPGAKPSHQPANPTISASDEAAIPAA